MIFDTHAHYDDDAFKEDRDAVFAQFPASGIGRVVDPGSTQESIGQIVALTEQYDFLYGALGIHPSECADMTEDTLEWIRGQLRLPKMVAVGEIGLDYHRDTPDRECQRHWFHRQLQLAREEGLPVIIHSRDAAAETVRILRQEHAETTGGVIHCYSYSAEMAQEFLAMGFYLGVGGVVTFKNSRKLRETVVQTPMERIVLETDSPYLAPVPHRGERNCSVYLWQVVETIAGLKEMRVDEVIAQTEKNAELLYGLGGAR